MTYLRPEVAALRERLVKFVEEECVPAEAEFDRHMRGRHGRDRWTVDAVPPCLERLKERSKELGFWNMFVPPRLIGEIPDTHRHLRPSIPGGLTYREYGVLCETLGRCPSVAPEACNASAPDTGNMEVLLEFGTPEQKRRYLVPLLEGKVRSTFLMTEPEVASSDPTNLETRLVKRVVGAAAGAASGGDQWQHRHRHHRIEYELHGRKWWSTGA